MNAGKYIRIIATITCLIFTGTSLALSASIESECLAPHVRSQLPREIIVHDVIRAYVSIISRLVLDMEERDASHEKIIEFLHNEADYFNIVVKDYLPAIDITFFVDQESRRLSFSVKDKEQIEIRQDTVIEGLIRTSLKDEEESKRLAAVNELITLDARRAERAFLFVLRNESEEALLYNAIQALRVLKSKEMIPRLKTFLNNDSDLLFNAAKDVLEEMEAVDVIDVLTIYRHELESAEVALRLEAVRGLITLIENNIMPFRNEEIFNLLWICESQDDNPQVRELAQKGLLLEDAYEHPATRVVKLPRKKDIKTVVVTGGAGFIGTNFCEYLLRKRYRVICIDNFIAGRKVNVRAVMKKFEENFILIAHDMTHSLRIDTKIDYVMHMASLASPPFYRKYRMETMKTGIMGTINALRIARRHKVPFVFTSTSEIYGNPQVHPQKESYWGNVNTLGDRSCYDESKRAAETIVSDYWRLYRLDVRIARIFNTFGPHMRVDDGRFVTEFIKDALRSRPLPIFGDGLQTRSICNVDDMVEGLHRLMTTEEIEEKTPPEERAVNLGNPEREMTVLAFAQLLITLTASHSSLTFKPLPADDPAKRNPDIQRAMDLLKWHPVVPIHVGLLRMMLWYIKTHALPVDDEDNPVLAATKEDVIDGGTSLMPYTPDVREAKEKATRQKRTSAEVAQTGSVLSQEEIQALLNPELLDENAVDMHDLVDGKTTQILRDEIVPQCFSQDNPLTQALKDIDITWNVLEYLPSGNIVEITFHADDSVTVTLDKVLLTNKDLLHAELAYQVRYIIMKKEFPDMDPFTSTVFNLWLEIKSVEAAFARMRITDGQAKEQNAYQQMFVFLRENPVIQHIPIYRLLSTFLKIRGDFLTELGVIEKFLSHDENQRINGSAINELHDYFNASIEGYSKAISESLHKQTGEQIDFFAQRMVQNEAQHYAIVINDPVNISNTVKDIIKSTRGLKLFIYTSATDQDTFNMLTEELGEEKVQVRRRTSGFTLQDAIHGGLVYTNNKAENVNIILRHKKEFLDVHADGAQYFTAQSEEGQYIERYLDFLIPVSVTFNKNELLEIAGRGKLIKRYGNIFAVNETYLQHAVNYGLFGDGIQVALRGVVGKLMSTFKQMKAAEQIKKAA